MPRILSRFLLPFVVVLLLFLGYRTLRSNPVLDDLPEVAQPSAVLKVQKSQSPTPPYIWWEAEKPSATNFPPGDRNPFAPLNASEGSVLSAGKWIGVDGKHANPLFLEYEISIPTAGTYFLYNRKFWSHGPFRWRWNDEPWQEVGKNVYLINGVGMRQFVGANWISMGSVNLAAGKQTLRIELTQNEGPAAFDCFVLTTAPFQPRGKLKPDEQYTADIPGWFLFDPVADTFSPSALDLRFLNESFAGERGLIQVKGEKFVQEKTGQPVRFWAVNISSGVLQMDKSSLKYMARFLAKRGVNLVRLHGSLWGDDFRQVNAETLNRLFTFVTALKNEGIYTGLSIYFPAWLKLDQTSGFAGYTGQNPYALLFFNPEFQKIYYGWWKSILSTVNPATGKSLREDPAIALIELVNEDSYFFWTFNPYQGIPEPQMEILEKQFGTWLSRKYGSIDRALAAWTADSGYKRDLQHPDQPLAGRVAFVPLYDLASKRDTQRAKDTAAFLTDSQKQFFQEAIQFLRDQVKYRGLVYASNWITANPQILGPLDKYANTVADFMDRHGYFSGPHTGPRASYTLSSKDTYQNQSALKFTSFKKGQEFDFNLPIMDIHYNNLPSTITEINWTPPNRYRADFPLLAAAYGLLQGSDGFFFFAASQQGWESPLDKFTVASPAILGQFPATALMYRKGFLKAGDAVADISLKLEDLYALRGTPIATPQNLDAFRAQDIQPGQVLQSGQVEAIDPLAFLVGKVNLNFSPTEASSKVVELSKFIDRRSRTVGSSTGELLWDYRQGLVTVKAAMAQGVTGFLRSAKTLELPDVTLTSEMDYGTLLLVSLDDRPLSQSNRILLQVMSEEQNFGWKTTGHPQRTIESVGMPPLVVRNLAGTVAMKRSDAAGLRVTALDANGYPRGSVGNADRFNLRSDTLYYLIEQPTSTKS